MLRLGVSQCYVSGLVFLRLRVGFLTFWDLSVFRLRVSFFYVLGLVSVTFKG